MEDEILLPPTDDEKLAYYEEMGIMKDYCSHEVIAEWQAERDIDRIFGY